MILFNIGMFVFPSLLAIVIHNYLRHGEMSGKRKLVFWLIYLFLINVITFSISYVRGVQGIRFSDMTNSYRLKYIGMGLILAFIMPFPVCLLTEDMITLGGLNRYAKRFISDMRKYYPYAVRAAKSDLHCEVANSYLNWLWWLIEPFCMMLIYTLIFGMVFKASEQYFPVFIFIGISMWSFFSRSISGSVDTVRAAKGIITKIYMPKYILLLSKMYVNAFKMMVSFGIVLIMLVLFGVPFSWRVILFIPLIIELFLFTFGLGTIMMHYGVYVNDLSYITGIILSMMMYFTGTFYSIAKRVPEPFGEIIEACNPVAFLISSMRKSLLYNTGFDWGIFAIWMFISLVMIALGAFTIYSNENAYVKVI